MDKATDILSLIGDTPLIKITRFDTGCCELFLKLENQNPAGSIKDRIGLSMISHAEKNGSLKPGGTIVEATAGNTGLGLALTAAVKGYKLILVIPDKMSSEKIRHLRAMGAKVVMTRSDVGKGHPEYYQDMAERIAKETPGAIYVNQFANPANPLAHETGTGPEIWKQMQQTLDAVVVGIGSGGTLLGLHRFFSKVAPQVEMVVADPIGSIVAEYFETGAVTSTPGSWRIEGIGEDFITPFMSEAKAKKAYSISDRESLMLARELLRREGILAGSSSGTLLAAALRYCKEQTSPKRVVTFACDSGNKYLSKMFNDYWMTEQGLLDIQKYGDLRDLIIRKYADGGIISVGPNDTLLTAFSKMKLHDISQLPVLENEKVVGILDESDLLFSVSRSGDNFTCLVKEIMAPRVETLSATASIDELLPIFRKGYIAIIEERGQFLGVITRIDLLNFLRTRYT